MRYVSFIHRDDAGYGVSFPDFPGCVSVGETVDFFPRLREFRHHVRSMPSRPTRNSATGGATALFFWSGSSRRVNISLDMQLGPPGIESTCQEKTPSGKAFDVARSERVRLDD